MITTHLRINHGQLARVIRNMPVDQATREKGFEIPANQSPYKRARFVGKQLILLKENKETATEDEYGVKLTWGQRLILSKPGVPLQSILSLI